MAFPLSMGTREAFSGALERELRRPSCVDQGVHDRLEQALRGPRILGRTADQPCRHDRRLTYYDEQPAADLELALEAFIPGGQRAGDGNGAVALTGISRGCQGVRRDDV